MRVLLEKNKEAKEYAEYLLKIGNGKEDYIDDNYYIKLPDIFQLMKTEK